MTYIEDILMFIDEQNDVEVFRLFHVELSKKDILQVVTQLETEELTYLCSVV